MPVVTDHHTGQGIRSNPESGSGKAKATKGQQRSKRKVNKDMVGELGEERSESRKQLIVCVKYSPLGIRNINYIKCCVWNKTQRADRK